MKFAHRFSGAGKPYEGLTKQTSSGPQWTGKLRMVEDALDEPLRWQKPSRIFVNSMSDLFHEDVPDAFIDKVFAVMALAGHHTFQILTKRADRMRAYLSRRDVGLHWLASIYRNHGWRHVVDDWAFQESDAVKWSTSGLDNVWLGVSVEDQKHADLRIPELLKTPAAVRFISAEPLLGPADLRVYLQQFLPDGFIGALADKPYDQSTLSKRLDWVIVGGESGPGARPLNVRWVRSIVAQCEDAGVRVFVKQLGAQWYDPDRLRSRRGAVLIPVGTPWTFVDRGNDAKGGDMSVWPEDLRVREFPR